MSNNPNTSLEIAELITMERLDAAAVRLQRWLINELPMTAGPIDAIELARLVEAMRNGLRERAGLLEDNARLKSAAKAAEAWLTEQRILSGSAPFIVAQLRAALGEK